MLIIKDEYLHKYNVIKGVCHSNELDSKIEKVNDIKDINNYGQDNYIMLIIDIIKDIIIIELDSNNKLREKIDTLHIYDVNIEQDIKYLAENGHFDEKYYLDNNLDVKNANIDPLAHYVKWGWRENRKPCQSFDNFEYIIQNYEVLINQDRNPFIYYCINDKKSR